MLTHLTRAAASSAATTLGQTGMDLDNLLQLVQPGGGSGSEVSSVVFGGSSGSDRLLAVSGVLGEGGDGGSLGRVVGLLGVLLGQNNTSSLLVISGKFKVNGLAVGKAGVLEGVDIQKVSSFTGKLNRSRAGSSASLVQKAVIVSNKVPNKCVRHFN